MLSSIQEPGLAGFLWDMPSQSHNQNMLAYEERVWPSRGHEIMFENPSYDTNPMFQEEDTFTPPFNYSATPIDIYPAGLVDSSFISPATMAVTPDLPGLSSSSSSVDSTRAIPHSGPGRRREGYYSSSSPSAGPVTFGGSSPPGLDVSPITTEPMEARPGQYGTIHFSSLAHRPGFKSRNTNAQPPNRRQGICDRRFVCTIDDCGKDFSGEWEKTRHIKSIHFPPTIGCRGCNYKQSRKDLFSEHCKKRHPGESSNGWGLPTGDENPKPNNAHGTFVLLE
ncbi:hypothetical protein BC826DRAFT_1003305 [Russula brevipes]|nr:hypothetical protein BC826DRAFT_1003305 [Russula brevipes]